MEEGIVGKQMRGPAEEPPAAKGKREKGKPANEERADDRDPAFVAALRFAMSAMYENGAADDMARALSQAPDRVEALASTAYDMTSITDERTEGSVPEDLIMLLGAHVLKEVAEVADAAGIGYTPPEIAEAFKRMVLRFVSEQGHDTSQLEAAMAEIDPAVFEQVAQGEEPEPEDGQQEEMPA